MATVVRYRNREWRVREVVVGVGGGRIAQLESLDEHAFCAVAESSCEAVAMTDAEFSARIAEREANAAPRKEQNRIALARRQVVRSEVKAARLRADGAPADVVASADATVALRKAEVERLKSEAKR